MDEEYRKILKRQHYGIVGNHSAVEVCGWTKKSLQGKGVCYKQKFYGINSHRCVQMSPSVICDQKCIFCWRANEYFSHKETEDKWDKPFEIIKGAIFEHLKKISGFRSYVDEKFMEALIPKHFAISLTGEPTLYPYLSEMIELLHKAKISTFLVTNSLHPETIEKLWKENNLPTQLYLSIEASNKDDWMKIDVPAIEDYWERVKQSLELLKKIPVRKTIRITLIRGLNDSNPKEFAEMFKGIDDLMIEAKSYMYVGYSRKRLTEKHMLEHQEVKEFAEKLGKELDFKVIGEQKESRVVLIAKNEKNIKIDFKGFFEEVFKTKKWSKKEHFDILKKIYGNSNFGLKKQGKTLLQLAKEMEEKYW